MEGTEDARGGRWALAFWAVAACAFSGLLLLARLHWSGSASFRFLGWNLFLAIVPLAFSTLAWAVGRSRWKVVALMFLLPWLLFFPNAPYILTDLLHLRERHPVPVWYDLIMLLSFALNGLFLGYLSLRQVEVVLSRVLHRGAALAASFLFVFLAAYGICLGRFLRLNSWDVWTRPRGVARDVLGHLLHPTEHPRTWALTLMMGALLWIGYRLVRGLAGVRT